MDEKITSRENAKVKYACRLASSAAFRRTEGRFLAEGRKLCPELARGAELETLFYTENALEKCPELAALPGEHYLVEDHVADKLADVGTHQGVFGVFRTPVHTLEEVRPGGRYLALERLDEQWTERLTALSGSPLEWNAPAAVPDTAMEQLLVYFVYRHFPAALEDGDIPSKAAFAALSAGLIHVLAALTGEPLTELARMYSAEIEYSDENLWTLFETLGEA